MSTTPDGARSALPPISPEFIRGNLLTFGRRLRTAGLPVGSGQVLSLVDALAAVDLFRHDDVYHAAKASVVTRPEQIPVFDLEFSRFWRELMGAKPAPLDPFMPQNAPSKPPLPDASKKKTEQRHTPDGAEDEKDIFHISEGEDDSTAEEEEFEASPDDVMLFSSREMLRRKDFSQCTPEEIAEARRILGGMTWRLGTRKTRRRTRAKHGKFIDARATLRASMRHGGMPLELRRQKRKIRTRPLVVICDISGSMDRYARLLLRFVHALGQGLENTEVFVFGTRLTR
ncbi:MAG: VWA domain-containing protein, partial [Chloroflexota bacterium]|nr:VWA domain-containing protein [Chloroflexota bacterium]